MQSGEIIKVSHEFFIVSGLADKILTAEKLYVRMEKLTLSYNRSSLTVPVNRLLSMNSIINKEGALIFRTSDRAKMHAQSCKMKAMAANANLSINQPEIILVDEMLPMTVDYEILHQLSDENCKIIVQCNKESKQVDISCFIFNAGSNSEKAAIQNYKYEYFYFLKGIFDW